MAARIRRDRYGILLLSPGGDSSSFFRSVEQTRAFGLGRALSLLFAFCPLVIVPCLSFWSNIVTAFAHCTTTTLLLCGSSRPVAKYNGFLSHLDVGYCEQGSKDLRTTQSPFSPSLTGRTNPIPPRHFPSPSLHALAISARIHLLFSTNPLQTRASNTGKPPPGSSRSRSLLLHRFCRLSCPRFPLPSWR